MSLAGCAGAGAAAAITDKVTPTMTERARAAWTTGLPASRGADDGGKALHPLQALRQALAAEVEDDLAHPEPSKGGDVVLDLSGRAGERPPLARPPVQRLAWIIDRRLVGDGEARGIATFRFGEPPKPGERARQLGWAKGHRGIRAHGMPPIAEARHATQRGLAVTAHPDRRMRLLHRRGQALYRLEPIEFARERGRAFGPERLHDAYVLVAHAAPAIEVGRAEGLELLAEPAHPPPHRDAPVRQHVDGREHLRDDHRVPVGNDQ